MSDLIYFGLIDHYSSESSFWGVIPGIKVPGMAGNEPSSFGRFNTEAEDEVDPGSVLNLDQLHPQLPLFLSF